MHNLKDESYHLVGRQFTRAARSYSPTLLVRRETSSGAADDDIELTFNMGDVVTLNGATGRWVAHCVAFYDIRAPVSYEDDEVQVVDEATTGDFLKVQLRWFYSFDDLEPASKRLVHANNPKAARNDRHLFLSDKIESQSVATILGHARVVTSERELQKIIAAAPDDDNVYWCEYLYGNRSLTSSSVRELNAGELAEMLKNPSCDELYRPVRPIRGCLRPAAKGLNTKRYSPTSGISTKDRISAPIRTALRKQLANLNSSEEDGSSQNAALSESPSSEYEASDDSTSKESVDVREEYPRRGANSGIEGAMTGEGIEKATGAGAALKTSQDDAPHSAHLVTQKPYLHRKALRKTLKRPMDLSQRHCTSRSPQTITRVKSPNKHRHKSMRKTVHAAASTAFTPPKELDPFEFNVAVEESPQRTAARTFDRRASRKTVAGRWKSNAERDDETITKNNDSYSSGAGRNKKMVNEGRDGGGESTGQASSISLKAADGSCRNIPRANIPRRQSPAGRADESRRAPRSHSTEVTQGKEKNQQMKLATVRKEAASARREDQVAGDHGSTEEEGEDKPLAQILSQPGAEMDRGTKNAARGSSSSSREVSGRGLGRHEEHSGMEGSATPDSGRAEIKDTKEDPFKEMMEVWAGMSEKERDYHRKNLDGIVSAMFEALGQAPSSTSIEAKDEWCDKMADESIRIFKKNKNMRVQRS